MGPGTLDENAQKEMGALIRLISDGNIAEADQALADSHEEFSDIGKVLL